MGRRNQGPRLVANAHGVFEIRWSEGRRSRTLSTRARDRATAERVFADWLHDREAVAARRQDPTVADALRLYLEEHIVPGGHDVARHETMARWLTEALGTERVRSLRPTAGTRYAAQRRSGEVGTRAAAPGTIRRELGMLQAALHHLVAEHSLARAPVLKRPAAPESEAQWLTRDQVDALLGWLEDQDAEGRMSRVHRFVVLALATAARKQAIETLRWEQVDLTLGLVRYDRQVRVQTRKRRVAAPVPAWAEPLLERMAAEAEGPWVLDHDGDITSAFRHAMARASKATGQDFTGLTRHGLRHTAATLALQAGASLWQVAGMLGDSLATVDRVYGHHCQEHVRAAANWRG